MYTKLRTEHVQLLRTNADVKKALTTTEKEKKEVEATLATAQEEVDDTSEKLLEAYQTAEATKEALKAAEETIEELKREYGEKQEEMDGLLAKATIAHEETEEKRKFAEEKCSGVEKTLNEKVCELETQLSDMRKLREEEEMSRKNAEEMIEQLKQESKNKQEELNGLLAGKTQAYEETDTKLKTTEQRCAELEESLKQTTGNLESTVNEIARLKVEAETRRCEAENKMENMTKESNEKLENEKIQRENADLLNKQRLLVLAVQESEKIVQSSLDEFENPKNCGTTCTAEYLVERMSDLLPTLDRTVQGYRSYLSDKKDVDDFVTSIGPYSHLLSECILLGKATSHMAPREDAEALVKHCQNGGKTTLELLQSMKDTDITDSSKLDGQVEAVRESIRNILNIGNALVPKEDESLDSIENAVEDEITSTAELVAEAVTRIEEMLKNARQADTGVKLEVNERILDSCNALMKAIRVLILKSKDLQGEIVEEGMGSASAKEFYKRHHRWTEGLISAAKAVGWGAKVLVDAADKVVKEGGKFEELVVASNEIAASTAQLVAASKVKALPRSSKLSALTTASKSVAEATGNVVASAKTGSEMIEDSKTVPDYSKLSLTQAKRLEMDSQVRVLELESQLEKERKRLGELRRTHYQLAGASEGWEEEATK
ncbi:huntingtin-interacting protein 1-like [Dendronephthya gigantea]|uniref:huntingtin-interacting protein 1-like n=1 Tax=Dendronephthya gigantea TaxID=151771 RepID=UPI00106A0903|nr:huntingtin-interacting protein 1-like [Dendronephthya gigantea]